MAFPIVASPLLKAVADDRSARGLAEAIELRLTPQTDLLWIESFAAGLSFYLERTIPVATADGDELRSNYILRNGARFFDESDMLLPLSAAKLAVSSCTGPRFLLVGATNEDMVDFIEEAGVSMLTGNRRWVAFGPDCGGNARFAPGSEVDPGGEVPGR